MNKKVALVTGSSRGIGRACIIEFAKLGFNVVINSVKSEQLSEELKEYVENTYGIKALTLFLVACLCFVKFLTPKRCPNKLPSML